MMTNNDRVLIERAEQMSFTEWDVVVDMVAEADTEAAKDRLQHIANHLYHKEEHFAGLL